MFSFSEYFRFCTDDVSNMPTHSPVRTLKVLTPKQNYRYKISSPRFSIFDRSRLTPTVRHQKLIGTSISQLIDLPTPKKFKNDYIRLYKQQYNKNNHTLTQNKLLYLRI